MTLRIKNIRMQIVLGMMSLIALIIAASLLGFAFFSRHKLRQMVLERAINQVTATVRYAEYILQNVPDYLPALQKLVDTEIDTVVNETQNVHQRFQTIFQLTGEVKTQEAMMKSAMHEHNAEAEKVLQAMSDMKKMTETVSSGAFSMLDDTKSISNRISQLALSNGTTDQMVQRMLSATDELKTAVESAAALENKNSENIAVLTKDISKFKV